MCKDRHGDCIFVQYVYLDVMCMTEYVCCLSLDLVCMLICKL